MVRVGLCATIPRQPGVRLSDKAWVKENPEAMSVQRLAVKLDHNPCSQGSCSLYVRGCCGRDLTSSCYRCECLAHAVKRGDQLRSDFHGAP